MALKTGTNAPDFRLPSTGGKEFELEKDFKGRSCILYFYPKSFTSGCTQEACDFRDNFSFFKNLSIEIVGISRDTIQSQEQFKAKYGLQFDLLSDKSGTVCKNYEALIPILKIPLRVTYLLDADHRIQAVYEDLFGAKKHIHRDGGRGEEEKKSLRCHQRARHLMNGLENFVSFIQALNKRFYYEFQTLIISAMSILFILYNAFITFWERILSSSSSIFHKNSGVICHEMPNLSLTQSQGCSCPFTASASYIAYLSALDYRNLHKGTCFHETCQNNPPLTAMNSWHSVETEWLLLRCL